MTVWISFSPNEVSTPTSLLVWRPGENGLITWGSILTVWYWHDWSGLLVEHSYTEVLIAPIIFLKVALYIFFLTFMFKSEIFYKASVSEWKFMVIPYTIKYHCSSMYWTARILDTNLHKNTIKSHLNNGLFGVWLLDYVWNTWQTLHQPPHTTTIFKIRIWQVPLKAQVYTLLLQGRNWCYNTSNSKECSKL